MVGSGDRIPSDAGCVRAMGGGNDSRTPGMMAVLERNLKCGVVYGVAWEEVQGSDTDISSPWSRILGE